MVRLLYLIIFALTTVSARRYEPFYRRDYKYSTEYNAFYKLHWDWNGKGFDSAYRTCVYEEAELFYPTGNEWKVAKELFPEINDTDIIVGIHDKFNLGEYLNIRGQLVDVEITSPENTIKGPRCVSMNIETGIFNAGSCFDKHDRHPYFCKKVEEPSCPTIDKGYVYFEETRKCYKLHHNIVTWSKAMETCFLEGGHLATVDSSSENYIISNQIRNNGEYFAGFFKIEEDFYSIKSKRIDKNGILKLEKNGNGYENYNCGTLKSYDNVLILYQSNCDENFPFICEIEVI